MNKLAIPLLCFFTLQLCADVATIDGIEWTYYLQDGNAHVGAGSWYTSAIPSSTSGAVAVPAFLGGKSVVSIECGAFYNCKKLTLVSIPASVRSLGAQAFYHCDNLTAIVFAGDEPTVGYTCFAYSPNVVVYHQANRKWDGFYFKTLSGDWNGLSAKVLNDEELVEIDLRRFRIPHSWISSVTTVLADADGDYYAALRKRGINGYLLSESYVAGLNPNDATSKFQVRLEITNGVPAVSWLPRLDDEETAKRIYTIYGRKSLSGDDKWTPIAGDECGEYNFFRVGVSMRIEAQ